MQTRAQVEEEILTQNKHNQIEGGLMVEEQEIDLVAVVVKKGNKVAGRIGLLCLRIHLGQAVVMNTVAVEDMIGRLLKGYQMDPDQGGKGRVRDCLVVRDQDGFRFVIVLLAL